MTTLTPFDRALEGGPRSRPPPSHNRKRPSIRKSEAEDQAVKPTKAQLNWVTAFPLREGCSHITFSKSSQTGQLWEIFLNADGEQRRRRVRCQSGKRKLDLASVADQTESLNTLSSSDTNDHGYPQRASESRPVCTFDWCRKQGRRYDVSRPTFRHHCDQLCKPWHCSKCGIGREAVQLSDGKLLNRCLDTNLCLRCEKQTTNSDSIEEERKIRYALQTGRIRPATRYLIDTIAERAQDLKDKARRAAILHSIDQIMALDEAIREEVQALCADELQPQHSFEVVGDSEFVPEDRVCRICREQACALMSGDRTILACEACAKAWTEHTGSIKWQRVMLGPALRKPNEQRRRRAPGRGRGGRSVEANAR